MNCSESDYFFRLRAWFRKREERRADADAVSWQYMHSSVSSPNSFTTSLGAPAVEKESS